MFRSSFIFSLAVLFLLGSCSNKKNNRLTPQSVDVSKVSSLVFLDDNSTADTCVDDIESSSATLVYQNDSGTILTDLKEGDISKKACKGLILANEKLTLERPRAQEKKSSEAVGDDSVDLPSLLKYVPAEVIGARSFVRDNPLFDGRGVKVAVLDTGLELDHFMLNKTSDGLPKIVAVQDFSGEGDFEIEDVTPEGSALEVASVEYKLEGIESSEYKAGVFKGSSLIFSEAVAAKDEFKDLGVLVYKSEDGSWYGRIDTNDDKNFADEVELTDTLNALSFVKIGEKQTLTVSLSVSKDGSKASLFFDDGGHGTHVAGIAAGYDPKGIHGVAVGAQVIGAKIGDNRLAGGSTTTASMVLAIDYAVQQGADVLNISYGIRAGSNMGASAIDQYVDKIAKEKDVLFAISAGNEGPGLLTVGTPAGARLAITNAAYLPLETGRNLYSFVGLEKDTLWSFSSVGPLFNGGWKPTLLAPGTALSSLPNWTEGLKTYSGTSMSSPQVTGGLALILSAAKQSDLPTDRATVTKAVYNSTEVIEDLAWIEQGHGLMQVAGAYKKLQEYKDQPVVEYNLSVTNPTAPTGSGAGIYVRSSQIPANPFSVDVTPEFAKSMPEEAKKDLKSFKLVASADWIKLPNNFHLLSSKRTFKVLLDKVVLEESGLHSEKITAINEATGEVAFEVPVTVVVPQSLSAANKYTIKESTSIEVGSTHRVFIDVPAGTTAMQVSFESDSSYIWGQLLDSEGRALLELRGSNRSSLQPRMKGQAEIITPGIYELDLVSSPSNPQKANVDLKIKAYSLQVSKSSNLSASKFNAVVSNHFSPLRVKADAVVDQHVDGGYASVEGDKSELSFVVTEEDKENYGELSFQVKTSKETYDLMTDYPYIVLDPMNKMIDAYALALDTTITIGSYDKLDVGEYKLKIVGAFAQEQKDAWGFEIYEKKTLLKPKSLLKNPVVQNIELGQKIVIPLDFAEPEKEKVTEDKIEESSEEKEVFEFQDCATLSLSDVNDELIQKTRLCL